MLEVILAYRALDRFEKSRGLKSPQSLQGRGRNYFYRLCAHKDLFNSMRTVRNPFFNFHVIS